jgi:transcription-repair coupling factor (superfamily II helicase)
MEITELLKPYFSGSIANNDTASSALFAALVKPPFAFITPGKEAVEIAKSIFEGYGLRTAIFNGDTDFNGDVIIIDDVLASAPIAETKLEEVTFTVGQRISINDIKETLEQFECEYSLRGDIVDILGDDITRIMFDGDRIENIKTVNPATLLTAQKLNHFNIKKTIQTENLISITNALRPFCRTIVLDNSRAQLDTAGFTVYKFRSIDKGATPFPTAVLPNYFSAMSILSADIIHAVKDGHKTVLLFTGQSRTAENYLRDKGIDFVIAKDNFVKNKINIVYQSFPVSVELKALDILIYSLTKQDDRPRAQETPFTQTAAKFIMPATGDCVVHSFHGIGRYIGTKKLTFQNTTDDYLVLQYDGGAVVYIPIHQTDMLSNYVGEPARLNKIGGQDFANAKQRVRRRLKELSFKLSELYQKRAKAKANIYEIDPETAAEFAKSFKYPLTPDQEKVMEEVTADMKSPRIMDRLVCGDVGYGKTEIAFRAAFNAVMSGYQVMMLCPTTILSVQHYNLAVERFTPFGIRAAVLNRFAARKETHDIIEKLRHGEIDLIIGTHKLLSLNRNDFANLGLLILDEEQRFGVEAKEKIKKITNNVDVLTMSATPIPRTLNLSLIGLRDISVITTPPKDRLSVITYVCEFSYPLLVDAITREAARGGQTIILYNDVKNIKYFTEKLRGQIDSRIKIQYIHGQMASHQIEGIIGKIYEHEIDVIVASTIIENGIDISTANTLFAVNADRLGVAQMHQLRGRVGRGTTQAYAYFTYAKEELVSTVSRERINAIKNFYSQGSGFNIAMRDLELRGGGEIFGANQSGHIEEVGMEAFAEILNEIAEENRQRRLDEARE